MPKKLLLPLLLTAVLAGCASPATPPAAADAQHTADTQHNARLSLDWAGTYRGLLPCADCAGLETTVVLRQDQTYHLQTRYIGKGGQVDNQAGVFDWGPEGRTVTLPGPAPEHYFVGEGWLLRLASDGSRISGPLADHYRLNKLD